MNWEIVLWIGAGLVLMTSVLLGVYQGIEVKRIDDAHKNFADWKVRHDAICVAWEQKHKIMPYAGPDVGWFIGVFGLWIPSLLYAITVYILNLIFHFL